MDRILSREDKLLYDLLGRLELSASDAQEIFQKLKNANKQGTPSPELMLDIINKSPLSGKIIGEVIPVLEEFASGKSLTKPHLSHVSQALKALGLPEDEFVGIKAQSERPNNLGKIDLLSSYLKKKIEQHLPKDQPNIFLNDALYALLVSTLLDRLDLALEDNAIHESLCQIAHPKHYPNHPLTYEELEAAKLSFCGQLAATGSYTTLQVPDENGVGLRRLDEVQSTVLGRVFRMILEENKLPDHWPSVRLQIERDIASAALNKEVLAHEGTAGMLALAKEELTTAQNALLEKDIEIKELKAALLRRFPPPPDSHRGKLR